MKIKVGIVMNDIAQIKVAKDTTLALMLAAAARGCELYYMRANDVYLQDGKAFACTQRVTVYDDPQHWFTLNESERIPLSLLTVVLLRQDPPFDLEYLYLTYVLEQAEREGVCVVNKPQSLRDANEKVYLAWFPHCCPETLVTSKMVLIREFLQKYGDIIIKPLDRMGGRGIFRLRENDPNLTVILETATDNEQQTIMVQRYLPEIIAGDKRIILIGGHPVPYALARIPQPGETRGNLAAGGLGEGRELTVRDRYLCEQVGPLLAQKGLWFVGLDVIGDFITEINVTSPTCVRELDHIYNLNIAEQFFDFLEKQLRIKINDQST